MPGTPIRVSRRLEHLRKSAVRLATLDRRRHAVDRGADERVAESDLTIPELHEADVLGGFQGLGIQNGGGRSRGGEEQRIPRRAREGANPASNVGAHHVGDRQRVIERLEADTLRIGQHSRDFHQREGIATGGGYQASGHRRSEALSPPLGEQLERRPGRQWADLESLQAGLREHRLILPNGEQEADALAGHPPRGEHERVQGRSVEELGVIDDDEQRPPIGFGRQQAEGAGAGRQAIGLDFLQGQRPSQGTGLHGRDPVEPGEEGTQQSVERGEWDVRLSLRPGDAQDRDAVCACGSLAEQRRLADPR
jgi:hypothetical protein